MVALFTKSLDAQLKAKRTQLDDNASRLTVAESRLTEARARVEQLALDADDKALDAALASKRSAEDKVGALKAAAAKISAEHADIEARVAKAADQKLRSESAAAVKVLEERWQHDQDAFIAATAAFEATSREVALLVLDANGTSSFLMSAKTEVPPAGRVILEGLRQFREAVLSGHQRASLPQAAVEPPKLKLVEPPMKEIVPLRHLKYTNDQGAVVCLGRLQRHMVPLALAEKAIRINAAVTVGDSRVRDQIGVAGMTVPSADRCEALDDTPNKPVAAPKSGPPVPIMSSHVFEPHPNVGKPYTKIVSVTPVEPLPLAASRMQPEDEV
jgi:hypothetical protein